LGYLKANPNVCMQFNGFDSGGKEKKIDVSGCCDSDWGGPDWNGNSKESARSTSGYFVSVAGNIVSWMSKVQPTVARSSTDAEWRALDETVREALWLRGLLEELGYAQSASTLLVDNKSAVDYARTDKVSGKLKYIAIITAFVKEKVQGKEIHLEWVKSENNNADALTKALARIKFREVRKRILLAE
jgi:hypothetical protein